MSEANNEKFTHNSLIQKTGRIYRSDSPVIFDIVDDSNNGNHCNERKKFYSTIHN